MPATFGDAEGAIQAWINTQTALVGAGKPLPKGALLNHLRTAAPAPYVLITLAGGGTGLGAESADQRARISGRVYGPTKESAGKAAAAYAETIATGLAGRQVTAPGAVLLVGDDIVGPLWAPDSDEPAYLVDFDLYLRPT